MEKMEKKQQKRRMPLLKQNIRLNAMTNPLCCGKSNEIMRRDNDGTSGGPA
jgi:hypothetical protein